MNDTAIIYMSTHGTCAKVAAMLGDKMHVNVTDIINVGRIKSVDLSKYSTVVIGGSIHMGQIQKQIKRFCKKNENELLKKKIGLFLCCMYQGDIAQKQFDEAYSKKLRKKAVVKELFGYGFNFESMGFIMRAMARKIANVNKSELHLNKEAIERFVKKLELDSKKNA